ncbi:M23 family metallopeptidase [Microbacterium jejuense]|uniref:M23 family metallopeptidase n=1 Tax=Microbacterium jejuense TaxID=1263637 RepID=A0ABS7HK67_9MICO|nr:M23 family metallopeptidase [Microbacterium jejuense]MBW9093088.1 M23 family metallopeptidase [Microbacterium jejuense]
MSENRQRPQLSRRALLTTGSLLAGAALVGLERPTRANAWPAGWPPDASDYAAVDRVAPPGFVQPFTAPIPRISSPYRSYRTCQCSNPHVGTDYNYDGIRGREFYSIGPGRVVAKGDASAMGYYIGIDHGDGVFSRYLHMDVPSALNIGDSVAAGTLIGYVGSRGAGAAHLHLEVCVNNGTQYQSPEVWLSNSPAVGEPAPTPVAERSFSINTAGTLEGKESALAPVVPLRENIAAVSADGLTVAAVDIWGGAWVLRGGFDTGWVGLASNAQDVAVDGDRFVVLHKDGNVMAKDGLFSSTWVPQIGGVSQIDAANGRIGVVAGGLLKVKEGTLFAEWTNQYGGVTDFALHGNRIGVVSGGAAYVKEGNLFDGWVPMAGAQRIELTSDRVGLLNGSSLDIKAGNLFEGWENVAPSASDFALSGNRIAVRSGGSVVVKTGALNAGWNGYFANSVKIALN